MALRPPQAVAAEVHPCGRQPRGAAEAGVRQRQQRRCDGGGGVGRERPQHAQGPRLELQRWWKVPCRPNRQKPKPLLIIAHMFCEVGGCYMPGRIPTTHFTSNGTPTQPPPTPRHPFWAHFNGLPPHPPLAVVWDRPLPLSVASSPAVLPLPPPPVKPPLRLDDGSSSSSHRRRPASCPLPTASPLSGFGAGKFRTCWGILLPVLPLMDGGEENCAPTNVCYCFFCF